MNGYAWWQMMLILAVPSVAVLGILGIYIEHLRQLRDLQQWKLVTDLTIDDLHRTIAADHANTWRTQRMRDALSEGSELLGREYEPLPEPHDPRGGWVPQPPERDTEILAGLSVTTVEPPPEGDEPPEPDGEPPPDADQAFAEQLLYENVRTGVIHTSRTCSLPVNEDGVHQLLSIRDVLDPGSMLVGCGRCGAEAAITRLRAKAEAGRVTVGEAE